MRTFILPFLLMTLIACSSLKTSFDYDGEADFTQYKTYALTEDSYKFGASELNRNRIIAAVEQGLMAKGFSKSDDPDVLIDLVVTAKQTAEATATTTGSPYGYRGYRYGGYSTTQIDYDEYTEGSLAINMIDNTTQKLVWTGIGSKVLNENASANKKEANINTAIDAIFRNYPPKK